MRMRVLFSLMLLCSLFVAAQADAQQILRLSTTTSTEHSGLLDFLLPEFEAASGIKVQVIAVGSGKALELAKNGDVDLTLVHARASEDKFVADGHGVNRRDVMYNDFILVGSTHDPAGIRGADHDILNGLKKIIDGQAKFISRGDNSGTDQMEQAYWNLIGKKPAGRTYISAGLGMGAVLGMAAELQAYTLTDRATYLAYRDKTGLAIVLQGDPRMFNPYGIIAVSPAKYRHVNYRGAMRLIDWLTSPAAQKKIAEFKIDGQQVFFPAANRPD